MSDQDSDYGGSIGWQNSLQIHRVKITNRIVYRKLSPFLKQQLIFDQDDDEEVSNAVLYPTEQTRMNRVVDKLMRKGEDNFNEFVKILGIHYPDLYELITGNEPPEPPAVGRNDDRLNEEPSGKDEVVNILLDRLEAKKQEFEQLRKLYIVSQRDLEEKTKEVGQHQNHIQELKRRGERYESMERDMAALKDVLDQVKNDNYKFCMRLVDINEENSRLRERNMAMRIEIDMKDTNLRKMKSTVDSERRQSLRYRTRIENGPSPQLISNLHSQIDELKLQLAQTKKAPQIPTDDNDTRIQILQTDKDEALQMCAEASEKLNRLREEFNTAENLRDKYLEENERFRLQVSALTDDCDMYKTRRDAVWQQLQEVEKERDQLMKERNEAQITAQNHMDEKTKYRTEIRQLEERLDERSFQLREKEAKVRELKTQLVKQAPSLPGQDPSQQSQDTSTESPKSPERSPAWKCNRPRAYNIKHYSEFMVKSEFEVTMEAKNNSIGADGEFPEIPLAKNYGNGCGNIGAPKKPRSESDYSKERKHSRAAGEFRRAIRIRERNISSSKIKSNSETHSRSSSTDSEQPRLEL